MKKVLVASFPRSGTHFLINNMATNFEGIENGWVDVVHGKKSKWVEDVNRGNLTDKIREHLVEAYSPHASTRCLKTHFQMYFFERHLDEILEKYDLLYVVRDPRDVMVACYHFYNETNFERFVKERDFAKFIRAELWNVRAETRPFSYSYVKPRNIVDKWNKHVMSWLHYKDRGVTFVRFSDLKNNLEETLKFIQSRTSQKLKPQITPVAVDDPRYRPDFHVPGLKRGQVGAWQEYFTDDDLKFLNRWIFDEAWRLFE